MESEVKIDLQIRTDSTHVRISRQPADICQCQTRDCNNPPPQHGGAPCTGARVRVTNCTVHGEWTAWSAWSACSQTCGFAMKTRRRTCTNPAPAFGGRVCVGHDHDDNICIDLPPCPAKDEAPPPESFGQWSSWGGWNACSRPCNGGKRDTVVFLTCLIIIGRVLRRNTNTKENVRESFATKVYHSRVQRMRHPGNTAFYITTIREFLNNVFIYFLP